MVQSSSVRRAGMSAHGDNVSVGSSRYYFRRTTRQLARPQDEHVSRQNDDKPSVILTVGSSKGKCKYCTHCLIAMLVILLCVVIGGMLFPYPLHASCIVKWKFDDPCAYVMQKLQRQIMNWSSWNACRQRAGACLYTANSVSNEWFMIFDYGTNYCNLHNLVVGAGLDRHKKFIELTNDAVCTQFNMVVC